MNLKHRSALGLLLNDLGLTGVGAEIGCYDGWFASAILQKWKGEKLYLIDAWKPYDDPEKTGVEGQLLHFVNAVHEMDQYGDRTCIIRDNSISAAALFKFQLLDFVYIDADHTLEGIKKDLYAWYPLVKIGGVISGHDYFNGNKYGFDCRVKEVVDDFCNRFGLDLKITEEQGETEESWLAIKK